MADVKSGTPLRRTAAEHREHLPLSDGRLMRGQVEVHWRRISFDMDFEGLRVRLSVRVPAWQLRQPTEWNPAAADSALSGDGAKRPSHR
jgi:hypothetical protein